MAQQRLYTEEQVRSAIKSALDGFGIGQTEDTIDVVVSKLIPIELPSDEEIEKESHNYFIRGQLGFEAAADTERAFLRGVLWMRDQILNK